MNESNQSLTSDVTAGTISFSSTLGIMLPTNPHICTTWDVGLYYVEFMGVESNL